MARRTEPQIREQLLEQSLEICVRVGFKNLSLRALAQELGTSHRMLIYHFGSSEQLFQAVVEEFRHRQLRSLEDDFQSVETWADFGRAAKEFWSRLARDENRLVMLSSLEIQLEAIRQGQTRETSPYLQAASQDWIDPIARTLQALVKSADESRRLARIIASSGRGLILDLLATQDETDKAEVREAFCQLIESLQSQ